MKTDRELMQQALEALVDYIPQYDKRIATITALRERLAQKEQQVGCEGDDGLLRIHAESETCEVCAPKRREDEPVAWVRLKEWLSGKDWPDDCFSWFPSEHLTPLYTRPQPAAQWVGLTDEEIQDLGYLSEKFDASNSEYFDRWGFAQAIEAKLKEKNGGRSAP